MEPQMNTDEGKTKSVVAQAFQPCPLLQEGWRQDQQDKIWQVAEKLF